ncbi:MAG: hypothetical protein Q4E12_00740 [Coriobacteriia bacterium]|nr:hypothetical protein [Coriobacteriia bacterium]
MFDEHETFEATVWTRYHVPFQDLPTLASLLSHCDQAVLQSIAEKYFFDPLGNRSERERCSFKDHFQSLIYEAKKFDYNPAATDDEWVLLPLEDFVARGVDGTLLRRILAPRVLLRSYDRSPQGWGVRASSSYFQEPWEALFSYHVWMGDALTVKERYIMLASAAWEAIASKVDSPYCVHNEGVPQNPSSSYYYYFKDVWGLSVQEDFEQAYFETLKTLARELNERAWENFCNERACFMERVVRVS